ncbi:hypothetical protein [Actinoplanes sp. NPDC026619]|uniref:hypothetical protein n=1 Tax=Actinoplanes sp. NPDC026619 TaxID=3155798 RepID=UPI0033D17BC1
MSKEYASLLAQVIPVIVLALGLELRSSLARFTANRANGSRPTYRMKASGLRVRQPISRRPTPEQDHLIFAMWLSILVLAFVEIKALSVVAGHSARSMWEFVLEVAILIAFLSPVVNAIVRTSFLRHETRSSWKSLRFFARALLPISVIAVMLYFLFIGPIFWQ